MDTKFHLFPFNNGEIKVTLKRGEKKSRCGRKNNVKDQRLLSHVRSAVSCSRSISRNLTALFEASRKLQANSHRMRIALIRKVHISGVICAVIAAGANGPEDSPIIRNCRLLSRDRTRPSDAGSCRRMH